MKVTDYIPKLYENNMEMQVLAKSEEEELETKVKPDIDNEFRNNFVSLATEDGIKRYEDLFGIIADTSETLDFRRFRIFNRMISHIPFTEEYLVERINEILGEGNWDYVLDYANYTLTINIVMPGHSWYNELKSVLEQLVPCNIDWYNYPYGIRIYAATWEQVKESFATWNDVKETCSTWQDVMDALWLNN